MGPKPIFRSYPEFADSPIVFTGIIPALKKLFTSSSNIDGAIRALISAADANKNGTLDKDELLQYCKSKGIATTPDEMDTFFNEVDYKGLGEIGLSSLRMWGVPRKGLRADIRMFLMNSDNVSEGLKGYIKAIDHDGTGLTKAKVIEYSKYCGTEISESEEP